jgi:hypothetical protein
VTSKTSLWADAVLRDRTRALSERARTHVTPERRRSSERGRVRTTSRIGPLRLVPAAVAFTTLALGLFAGTAYAYFGVTASGSGDASVGHLQPVVIEHATGTVTGLLFPGGTGTLALKVTNPNPFAVTVVGVAQDGPVTVTTSSGGGTGCTSDTGTWPALVPGTSGVSVASTATVASGLRLSVAAGPSKTTTLTVVNGATMRSNSNTTCQGATFHIPVVVTVHT